MYAAEITVTLSYVSKFAEPIFIAFQYLSDVLFKVTKFHCISDRKASCKYFQSSHFQIHATIRNKDKTL